MIYRSKKLCLYCPPHHIIALPWKENVNHLGFTLTRDGSSASDTMEKRASFISNVYNLNQEFAFANPEVRLKMCRLYNTSFYGSNCWEFRSKEIDRFSKTWNVNLRILFDLPRETHCWMVEEISGGKQEEQKALHQNSLQYCYRRCKDINWIQCKEDPS
jgi:hypothetical protein